MTGLLDSSEIEITCANCSGKTKKSIGWIKRNNKFTCACGTVISLDTSEFKTKIAKIERSLNDLGGTFNGKELPALLAQGQRPAGGIVFTPVVMLSSI